MTKILFIAGALTGLAIGTWMAQVLPEPKRAESHPVRDTADHARLAERAEV